MKILSSIVLFFTLTAFSFSQDLADLQGYWERVEGNFVGMKMDIHSNASETVGVLLTDSEDNYFSEGDVKWKGLVKTADGEFVVQSLYIELGIYNEPIARSYIEKVIWFISPDMICVISKDYDSANSSGHIQYWVRQNSI